MSTAVNKQGRTSVGCQHSTSWAVGVHQSHIILQRATGQGARLETPTAATEVICCCCDDCCCDAAVPLLCRCCLLCGFCYCCVCCRYGNRSVSRAFQPDVVIELSLAIRMSDDTTQAAVRHTTLTPVCQCRMCVRVASAVLQLSLLLEYCCYPLSATAAAAAAVAAGFVVYLCVTTTTYRHSLCWSCLGTTHFFASARDVPS